MDLQPPLEPVPGGHALPITTSDDLRRDEERTLAQLTAFRKTLLDPAIAEHSNAGGQPFN